MELIGELRAHLAAVARIGGDARPLRVDPPATLEDVRHVEQQVGVDIAEELRRIMVDVSAHLEFRWFLPKSAILPHALREIFCGDLHWGLDLTPNFVEGYRGWIETCFPNPSDPYDLVWHGKFPFHEVGNGDMIAIDAAGRVVYLSHDGGDGHGYVMADSFSDLLERWVPLGCVGGEDWQWLPFTNGMSTRIDPRCENAAAWKAVLLR